uniref:Uncharacterized protein n=1 Tax=Arundo donax TaxID=35708 RepID=A0A0A9BBK9_ARUDO
MKNVLTCAFIVKKITLVSISLYQKIVPNLKSFGANNT